MVRHGVAMALAAALLLQASPRSAPETQPWRYRRALQLSPTASGEACAVLDATVFAHAAGRAANDLRVFRESPTPAEVPFTLNESEAQPEDLQTATTLHAKASHESLAFDLAMPPRRYTMVDLQLAAKDFVGTATVTGSDGRGGPPSSLGVFTLFDLSAEHLARSTALPLQDADLPLLHIVLRLRNLSGRAIELSPALVQGAELPPSREAQTLYTTVASTTTLVQEGTWTVATFHVPAHVPIERVSFGLDPAFHGEFRRGVTVSGNLGSPDAIGAGEVVDGDIWRVARPARASGTPAIHAEKLGVDAVLASNLRGPAVVTVAVEGAAGRPLRSVALEMRQRTVCFSAAPGQTYTLRYGDATLAAPVYAVADSTAASTLVATLGPEVENPRFVATQERPRYPARHPELLWIGLLAAAVALGSTARHHFRHRAHHGRRNP